TAADRCLGHEEGTASEDEPGSGVTAMGCSSTAGRGPPPRDHPPRWQEPGGVAAVAGRGQQRFTEVRAFGRRREDEQLGALWQRLCRPPERPILGDLLASAICFAILL